MSNQQINHPNENQPNQEIDNNNLVMSSVPSFQSINSLNPDVKENKIEDEGEGVELQVVQGKSDKRINHEQILRMFNEQLEKQQREREQIELKRRESIKNKSKTNQKPAQKKASHDEKKTNKEALNERLLALSEKSNRIKKRIEEYCKKYKSMYRPSIYDTKMQKFRFECKEKLFFHLCFGFQQLMQLSKQELSENEQEIATKNCYDVCRKLAFDIDLQMVKILNKSDKYEISREYKQQFQTLLNNLKDENNNELRRKIITKVLTPSRIAIASEIEFFTTAKREELLEKQKRYIAEFTVENVLVPFKEQENEEIMERPRVDYEDPKEEAPVLKPQKSGFANKYLEQSSVLQLQELLSENQLDKMMKRLQEDLQGRSRSLLISNFKEVFGV